MKRRHLLFAALGAASLVRAGAAPLKLAHCGHSLRFPTASATADLRNEFSLELLALALNEPGCVASLGLLGDFSQPEGVRALREGRLDVAVSSAPVPADAGVLVVREPIRRGLLGLRLLVCKVSRAAEIAATPNLAALCQRYSLGYGADWADLAQYQHQGFRTVTATRYDELFELLHRGDCDLLSRGINEVWDEVDSAEHGRGALMAVPSLGLSYPLDDFFVVRPDAPDLHAAITQGLQRAQRDGRYQALFERYFKLAVRRSGLQYRRLLPLTGYASDPLVARAQAALLRSLKAST